MKKNLRTKLKEKALVQRIKDKPLEPLKASLEAVGYSPAVQNNPHIITQRPSFIQLLEESGITDQKLSNKLDEGLEATKLVIYGQEVIEPPDHNSRHKYLETALKLKGHLTNNTNIAIQANDYKLIIDDNT